VFFFISKALKLSVIKKIIKVFIMNKIDPASMAVVLKTASSGLKIKDVRTLLKPYLGHVIQDVIEYDRV
jgi:hypothetical protein